MRKCIKISLSVIVAVLIANVIIFCIYGDRIAVFLISRIGKIGISYGSIRNSSFRHIDFTDLVIDEVKTGMGLTANRARIKPLWLDLLGGKLSADFSLNGVSFTEKLSANKSDYESLSGLVAMPFGSKWKYREIAGSITIWRNSIHLRELKAVSDEIKLSLSGDFWDDHTISSDITIYFSNDLFKKIPNDIVRMVLADEPDGWRSLSVRLTGNYHKPSVQITGKSFRFNIGLNPPSPS